MFEIEEHKQHTRLGAKLAKTLKSLGTSIVPKYENYSISHDEGHEAIENVDRFSDRTLSATDKLDIYRGVTPIDGDDPKTTMQIILPSEKSNDEVVIKSYTENHDTIRMHRSQLAPSAIKPEVQATFKSTKKWEGMIIDITDDSFSARLVSDDLSTEDEYTTFNFEEIDPADHDLIVPGAIFYWNVGYTVNSVGTKTRDSIIIFRRSPRWSPIDRQRIEEESQNILRCFDDSTRA
jgi:hypothetical protein